MLASIKISARGLLPLVETAATSTVGAQAVVPPGPIRLVFPDARDKDVMHVTIDRYDVKQYREFWAAPGLEGCDRGRGRKLTAFHRSCT